LSAEEISLSVFVPAMVGAVQLVVPPLLDPPLDDPPLEEPPLEDPPLDDPPLEDPPDELDVVPSSPSSVGSVLEGAFVGCDAGVVDSTVHATRIEAAAETAARERSRRMKHSLVMKEQPASDEARPWFIHVLVALLGLFSCSDPEPQDRGKQWPEADVLFRSDPRWLGGDGALSIPLGGDRTLWLFGDTFVAKTPNDVRTESEMVRNTVAVQSGADPTRARIEFAWRTDPDGSPASFFAEQGEHWHWPGHGVRLPNGGPLIVFLMVLRATPNEGLGFASAGWRVARVDDVDGSPSAMRVSTFDPPPSTRDAVVGCAAVIDGDHVVAFAPGDGSAHRGYLVRMRLADLAMNVAAPEWWTGTTWGRDADARPVMDDVGAECSVHFDARHSRWVHVASQGFGASSIVVRFSSALEGPWSAPVHAFTPPESRGEKPFVYAAKAHPELTTGDAEDLVVTYATNSFDFGDLFTAHGSQNIYWPRFVRLRL
jgi:hypothetical protein